MAYGDRIWKYNRIRCKTCNAILLDRDTRTLKFLLSPPLVIEWTGPYAFYVPKKKRWYCKTCKKYVQPKGVKVFGKEWSCRYCKNWQSMKRKDLLCHEKYCKLERLGGGRRKEFVKQNLHLIEEDVLHQKEEHPWLHSDGIPAFDNWFWDLVEKGDWWLRTSPEELEQKRRESWDYH